MLSENESLIRAGVAIVVLRPRDKRPRDTNWTELPRWSWDEARKYFPAGANIGIRLGQPSQIDEFYVYGIDLDIRSTDPKDIADAKARLLSIVGDVNDFASVLSGSGGESRHYYFLSDGLFRTKSLAHSKNKVLGLDKKWHWAWEIDLGGTGRQFVLPPSIHPLTRRPYEWIEPFNIYTLPLFYKADVEAWFPRDTAPQRKSADLAGSLAEWFHKQGPRFALGEIEDILDKLADNESSFAHWVEDREGWLTVGMALHDQSKGAEWGFDLWCSFSAASDKFDFDYTQHRWETFGLTSASKNAVTMRTLYMESKRAHLGDEMGFSRPTESYEALEVARLEKFERLREQRPGVEIRDDTPSDAGEPLDADYIQERFEAAIRKMKRSEAHEKDRWQTELDLTDTDQVKNTPTNIALITTNDWRLEGIIAQNDFTHEVVQLKTFPALTVTMFDIPVKDPVNGDLWQDAHDTNLNLFFNTRKQGKAGGIGMKPTKATLEMAVVSAAMKNRFHPIRDYLKSVRWDGVPRAELLFIDYLGCPDRLYFREVPRMMLIAAVARVFEPGHKWDFAPILEGVEGKRKSSFIEALGKSWFGELSATFHDRKALVEQMQGKWIMELPELTGMSKSEVGDVKAFMSTRADHVRLAYAKRAAKFPRQSVMIGSTNDGKYLASETGNRRFFPIPCDIDTIDTDRLKANIDQIWAEAYQLYRDLRRKQPFGDLPLYLSNTAAGDEAFQLQASRKIESAADVYAGQLESFLNDPATLADITGDMSSKFSDSGPNYLRTSVCSLMAWQHISDKPYNRGDLLDISTALGKVKGWGRHPQDRMSFANGVGQQRAFVRTGCGPFEWLRGYVKIPK